MAWVGRPRATGPTLTSVSPGGNIMRGREGAVLTRVSIRGGPEAAMALARLREKVAHEIALRAVLAGGEEIRETWSAMTPKKDHDYERSITAVASMGRDGATGLVFPADIAGLEDSQQPRRYAPRLEFGSGRTNKRMLKRGLIQPGRERRPQPSARPAFDSAKGRATDAIADELRHGIERAS